MRRLLGLPGGKGRRGGVDGGEGVFLAEVLVGRGEDLVVGVEDDFLVGDGVGAGDGEGRGDGGGFFAEAHEAHCGELCVDSVEKLWWGGRRGSKFLDTAVEL